MDKHLYDVPLQNPSLEHLQSDEFLEFFPLLSFLKKKKPNLRDGFVTHGETRIILKDPMGLPSPTSRS